MTKGEFARLKGRTPQAISNWIAGGKITGAALIGDGHGAKIWVEQADADLARRLDPSQQVTRSRPVMPPLADGSGGALADLPLRDVIDDDLRRRRRADADKAQHDAEAARRRLLIDEGKWVLADAASAQMGRIAVDTLIEIESWLATVAEKLVQQFRIPSRDVLHALRTEFITLRTAVAKRLHAEAQSMPKLIEDADDERPQTP